MPRKVYVQFGELEIGSQFTRPSVLGVWEKISKVRPYAPLETANNPQRSLHCPNCRNIRSEYPDFIYYETLVLPAE
jgi:hypothetical protein